jgi:hypothetical protein
MFIHIPKFTLSMNLLLKIKINVSIDYTVWWKIKNFILATYMQNDFNMYDSKTIKIFDLTLLKLIFH